MKKVLFLLVALCSMMMANAQIKLIVNEQEYAAGATIPVTVTEEDAADMDYIAMIMMYVKNESANSYQGVTMEAVEVSAPGFGIMSVCANGNCQPGTVSPAFDVNANTTGDMMYAEFKLAPAAMAADKKGTFKLMLHGIEEAAIEYNLEITFVPSQAGIDAAEMKSVKLYPNPVASKMMVSCKDASEVVIFDVAGKLVKRVAVSGAEEVSIDMSSLNAGIYMCGTMMNGVLKGISRVVKY